MIAASEWDRCAPWIEAALDHSGGSHLIGDVRHLCETDPDYRFLPGEASAAVVQIIEYPRLKRLHLWLNGGDMAELVEVLLPIAEVWGRNQGCSQVTTAGRPGWDRVMARYGFQPAARICMKELTS